MNEPWYQIETKEVLQRLNVNSDVGLLTAETKKRLEKYGPNVLEQKQKISPLKIFFEQFKDFLIIILLAASGVSILLGERLDGILILAIVLAVALVGFFNEYKAEKTIEALRKLVAPEAKVRRDGKVEVIDARGLVPGDIVMLEEGQKIPADIRLLEAVMLQLNEAPLTGESESIFKATSVLSGALPVGDQQNMVFSGTSIESGKGLGVVVRTGNATEIGKIATLVDQAVDEDTPMQKKLDRLGKQLGYGVLGICVVVFIVIFFLDHEALSLPLAQRLVFGFIVAVALAVAAIPEGLAFVVRISLALGARRMAKRNALVRKLSAVEALGSTDIICCDKTGTLTTGVMTVREIWQGGKLYSVSGAGYDASGSISVDGKALHNPGELEILLRAVSLCNNAILRDGKILGDTTEGALLVAAKKVFKDSALIQDYVEAGEIPFSSIRKKMSTVHKFGQEFLVNMKGAAEVVLGNCTHALINGETVPLTDGLRKEILEQDKKMSTKALRVLGVAYKKVDISPSIEETETELTFVGLTGMMDPPRSEIAETISVVTKRAGMKVVMITGDHVETAKAVSREIGIEGEAISGPELDKLSEEEFKQKVEAISIYARVSPEHKLRIVLALKEHGHQVAMTGDGVNDAPAIKAADIGIAMGITGTDVAKEAADVILLDDHFITIVNAVEEGRGIYENIRKFVNFLLSCNIAEVFIVVAGILLIGELPLTAVQLLFINIVTDGLPAIALGSDPPAKGIMNWMPSRFQAEIITRKLWAEMLIFGLLMTTAVMLLYFYKVPNGLHYAVAIAFTATVVLEMGRLVSLRASYKVGWLANPWLLVAIVSSLVLQLLVVYVAPFSVWFAAGGLTLIDWILMVVASVVLSLLMYVVSLVLTRVFPELNIAKH